MFILLSFVFFEHNRETCIHTTYVALCTSLHAFFYWLYDFFFSLHLGIWWANPLLNVPNFLQWWIKLICLFFGCIHWCFPLSLPLAFFFHPSVFPSPFYFIHSLFKHGRLLRTTGNEVSPHLRWATFILQLLLHMGH